MHLNAINGREPLLLGISSALQEDPELMNLEEPEPEPAVDSNILPFYPHISEPLLQKQTPFDILRIVHT
ncbi:hypothetical protein KIN20_031936 [Parelaphostrongylus tenuis]|uniref:Uncharacterized protein n=1 Tax=Parelaphostrongylus tenuis TaxID=148309 RepID=A0AAD5R646_PARTN|nr:hypothetical protein KIN20_031936 [Parelaphostrongylus tenuis]